VVERSDGNSADQPSAAASSSGGRAKGQDDFRRMLGKK